MKKTVSTFDAYEVGVELKGSIEEYAMNFLKIFNNVKTRKELIRVTNNYNNGVFVVCTTDSLGATKEFLSWFGEVTSVERVLCVKIDDDFDYDFDKYEDIIVYPYLD